MKLGVFANLRKPNSLAALQALAPLARQRGHELLADAETLALLGTGTPTTHDRWGRDCDAMLVFGGDGSILHANRVLDGNPIPIAGINTGTLGFMACADARQLDTVLEHLQKGDYTVEKRRMLQCTLNSPPAEGCPKGGVVQSPKHALNDIVVARGGTGRIVSLELSVDGRSVTTYKCDGLIVATPTGSTAYSLSAGGPILLPTSSALIVSVICPHTLSTRPLVLPETSRIEITVRQAVAPLIVSVDGTDDEPLHLAQSISISLSPRVAHIVQLPGHDPFAVLSAKLGWNRSTSNT